MIHEENKIHIPIESLQEGTTQKDGVTQTVEVTEEYTYGVTEERVKIPISGYGFFVMLETNQAIAIVNKIQDCYEVKKSKTWHYIPRNMADDATDKKYMLEFYCVDNKSELKRFTKTIKKYFPDREVNWSPITQDFIKEYNEINNIQS